MLDAAILIFMGLALLAMIAVFLVFAFLFGARVIEFFKRDR